MRVLCEGEKGVDGKSVHDRGEVESYLKQRSQRALRLRNINTTDPADGIAFVLVWIGNAVDVNSSAMRSDKTVQMTT
jgi:hypothetical protein